MEHAKTLAFRRFTFRSRQIVAMAALALASGCHREAPAKTYQMRGAVIHNEKINGWMDSMTMEFPVHDASLLNGLKPGDHIVATVHVKDDLAYWIDDVKKQ
jgi:Cu/Ag efflux protein CusF